MPVSVGSGPYNAPTSPIPRDRSTDPMHVASTAPALPSFLSRDDQLVHNQPAQPARHGDIELLVHNSAPDPHSD